MVELMVQLRMSFASVHHFLEGKKGRDSKNEPNRNEEKQKEGGGGRSVGAGSGMEIGQKADRQQ